MRPQTQDDLRLEPGAREGAGSFGRVPPTTPPHILSLLHPPPTPSPPISPGQLASPPPPGRPSPPSPAAPGTGRQARTPAPRRRSAPARPGRPGEGSPRSQRPRRGMAPRAERWPRQAGGLPSFLPSFLPHFLTNPPAPPGPESCPQALAGPDCGEGDWPTGRLPGSRHTLPTGEHSAGGAPPGASRPPAPGTAGCPPGKGPPVHHPGNPSDHSANSSAPLPACQLATGPGRAPAGLVMGKRAKGQPPPSDNWRAVLGEGRGPGGFAAASGCKRPGPVRRGPLQVPGAAGAS